VEPSLKSPVAVNCWVLPAAIDAFEGATVMALRAADVTVTEVLPVKLPTVAEIVTLPTAIVLTNPVLSTVETLVSDEVHTTEEST
jgi:hypothetical protein